MVFIHVIIPCYKVETYLEQTVESVLKQPFSDIDIVLVDDGSPGKTPQLCDEIAEKESRVHVIHQANGGVSAARNAGISYILDRYMNDLKGHYFAFLDADDIWTQSFFTDDIVALLENNYDSVVFRSLACNDDCTRAKSAIPCSSGMQPNDGLLGIRLKYHIGAALHSCLFVQRNNILFPQGVLIAEDTVFQMKCCYLAQTVWQEQKIFYLYRKNKNSIFHTRKFGIPHFLPIINAFIQTDYELNCNSAADKAPHICGRQLARHYLHEMIKEHYQIGGSSKELDELFDSNQHFLRVIARDDISDREISAFYQSLQKEYMRKRWNFRIKGLLFSGIRLLRRIPIINACVERKIYPDKIVLG
jgi:glycosyltransferase EpsJ